MIDSLPKIGVVITSLVLAVWYSHQIYRNNVSPTITTWGIFLTASGVSLITYLLTGPEDISANILNILDLSVIFVIFLSTLIFTDWKTNITSFHYWYGAGAVIVLLIWGTSEDAFTSNILMQTVMFIGYIPTIQTLYQRKENVESYPAWILAAIAGIFAAFPALQQLDILALLYVGRTVVMCGTVITMMIWYDLS